MSHRDIEQSRSPVIRTLLLAIGWLSVILGIIGIFLPVLPTAPLILLAAFCFSRGSERLEAWMLNHRRFGPMIHDWRRNRSVPLRAKQLATVMMAASSLGTWWWVQSPWRWAPGIACVCVALWLWSLPTSQAPSVDE